MDSILNSMQKLILCSLIIFMATAVFAEEPKYALNIYGAKLTSNNWDEFFTDSSGTDFIDSKILVVSLAKRIGRHQDLLSYEIEGQVAKHDGIQDHWEFNALGAVRWEPFWWDRHLETSVAFGLGPSFATDTPKAEVQNEGESQNFMLYWMMELALSLPEKPDLALITRIHHRSEAYGLIADEGGSNALAIGLKVRF